MFTAAALEMSNRRLSPSQYSGIPRLNKYNHYEWALQVKIHLFGVGAHYWDVLKGYKQADGTYADPVAPTDKTELDEWNRSEQMAYDLIVATAGDLHVELMLRHRGKPYKIWKAIKEYHKQFDALLRREALMEALAIRKKPDETYTDFYHRAMDLHYKVQRLTPKNQTAEERGQELTLCALLNALPKDNYLRRTFTAADDLSLDDVISVFCRVDADERIRSVDAASRRTSSRCHMCNLPGHAKHDCPHRDAIIQLVDERNKNTTRTNGGNNGRRHRGRRQGNYGKSTQTNTAPTPGTTNTKARLS